MPIIKDELEIVPGRANFEDYETRKAVKSIRTYCNGILWIENIQVLDTDDGFLVRGTIFGKSDSVEIKVIQGGTRAFITITPTT